MEIPLRPLSREEIHKLETALLFYTMFRKDVFEIIKDPAKRVTWVDSLAVAAGAVAREKAGFTVTKIAEELGRTETTIREHLEGKSKAGKFVKETYEMLARGKTPELIFEIKLEEKRENIKRELEEIKKRIENLLERI